MARLRSQTDILNPTLIAAAAGSITTSETAPTNPIVGQRWFRLSTSVLYQYTSDGTTSFWLDISSGGIGTSSTLSADYVGDIDPHKTLNPAGLALGSLYYNRETNKYFECTNATSGSNVWTGRFIGFGGVEGVHSVGGTNYRTHTFTKSGTFILDGTKSLEILMVAGGGGGGTHSGGGGGAGGLLYYGAETPKTPNGAAPSKTAAAYSIVIGAGGSGSGGPYAASGTELVAGGAGLIGGNTTAFGYTAIGGGRGGTGGNEVVGGVGGSGGAGGRGIAPGAGTGSGVTLQGYAGGTTVSGADHPGGGGGGAGGAGTGGSTSAGGVGGVGLAYVISGTSTFYGGGGGGNLQNSNTVDPSGLGGNGGGGRGTNTEHGGIAGRNGTGGGGGGAMYFSNKGGGAGGSGIVIIRYALN